MPETKIVSIKLASIILDTWLYSTQNKSDFPNQSESRLGSKHYLNQIFLKDRIKKYFNDDILAYYENTIYQLDNIDFITVQKLNELYLKNMDSSGIEYAEKQNFEELYVKYFNKTDFNDLVPNYKLLSELNKLIK